MTGIARHDAKQATRTFVRIRQCSHTIGYRLAIRFGGCAVSNLQTRAEQLIAAGYRPVPVHGKQLAYKGDTPERDYAPNTSH